jgi:hypothetical protein
MICSSLNRLLFIGSAPDYRAELYFLARPLFRGQASVLLQTEDLFRLPRGKCHAIRPTTFPPILTYPAGEAHG